MFSAMKDLSSIAKLKNSGLTFHNDFGSFLFALSSNSFQVLNISTFCIPKQDKYILGHLFLLQNIFENDKVIFNHGQKKKNLGFLLQQLTSKF